LLTFLLLFRQRKLEMNEIALLILAKYVRGYNIMNDEFVFI